MKETVEQNVGEWLQIAALWRLTSVLFQPPTRETCDEFRRMVDELRERMKETWRPFADIPYEHWEAEYHRILGPGGIAACESSYDLNALAGRGPMLAEISGFYEAFAYRPTGISEVPDHLAIELGFLSYLAVKIAFGLYEGQEGASRIAREAYEHFQQEHLFSWVRGFQERIEATDSTLYRSASVLLSQALRENVSRRGADWTPEAAAEDVRLGSPANE